MAERLPVIVRQPRTVIDWWHATGASADVLRAAYPKPPCVAVAPDERRRGRSGARPGGRRAAGARRRAERRWRPTDAGGSGRAAVGQHDAALVRRPAGRDAALAPALAVDGFLMFSTLGPGSLEACVRCTPRGAGRRRMRPSSTCTTWATCWCGRLRRPGDGPGDGDPELGRRRGAAGRVARAWAPTSIRAPRRPAHAALARGAGAAHSQAAGADGAARRCVFEIVYGHAFRPPPRAPGRAETAVGLQDMRSMLAGVARRMSRLGSARIRSD